jgi:aspartyl-tRNA(Asn)/glutamyl-tRNA(Gln) amidotransferase subunit A
MFRRDLGIDQLEKLPEAWRGPVPLDNLVAAGRAPRQPHDAELGPPAPPSSWPRTHASLRALFLSGQDSPLALGRRSLAGARSFAAQSPSMGPLMGYDDAGVERDAQASAARYQAGASLGPLDGVPIAVKEETAIAGFPLRLGTSCLPGDPAPADATIVARLRAAGALIVGQTPMTEYGMSPLGINPNRRLPRNPHELGHLPGGSSTGSAVAVAEGLMPLAIAADGGGSIRIPASYNGIFGLKPTWGRVSRAGDAFGGSVNHLGPVGASAHDLAVFLEACGAPDEADPITRGAPPIAPGSLVRALGRGVRGLRIGVLEGEISAASGEVGAACRAALAALETEGATLVPLRFDFARYAAPVGYLTISYEAFADLRAVIADHLDELGPDLQIMLATVGSLTARDLSDALRLRSGLRLAVATLLRDVDVLALPTTLRGAPAATDDEAKNGFVDPAAVDSACRCCFLGNLTGLPAGTAPVGLDAQGLPLGLQIVGDAFDEATVLGVLAHLERTGAALVHRPRVSIDITRAG